MDTIIVLLQTQYEINHIEPPEPERKCESRNNALVWIDKIVAGRISEWSG